LAQLPVRGILLLALLALGSWGTLSACFQLADALRGYRQSADVITWARTTNNLFRMAQHFAYERGRTALILRAPTPVSAANRNFIDQRRQLADQAMQDFLQQRQSLPELGQEVLVERWAEIQTLRRAVDRDMSLPLARRDPQLAAQWYASATDLLLASRRLTQILVANYVRNRGLEVARLTLIAGYAFELRLAVGAEAAQIGQQLAGGGVMSAEGMAQVYELRGQQQMLWAEIERLRRYAPIPALDSHIDAIRKAHHQTMRGRQDVVLAAWKRGEGAAMPITELTDAAQTALDGISELMQLAALETERVAIADREAATHQLLRSLMVGGVILIITLLTVWYVLRRIVKPLEQLDHELRRLIMGQALACPPRGSNEIGRLREAIVLVMHLWKEKNRLESELSNLAFHDSLTGLPNRRLLMERLQHARIKNERRDQFACLLFLDLDKFKQVNDNHGHELGDRLLIAVAERLRLLLREEDTIARLGGDEFIVLLESLGSDEAAAHAAATRIRDKLDQELALPYTFGDIRLSCSVSIGYKLFNGSDEDAKALIRSADADMYQCKNERDGGHVEVSRISVED
jgi:diguanylate cyclase (GGDEF)-like protein